MAFTATTSTSFKQTATSSKNELPPQLQRIQQQQQSQEILGSKGFHHIEFYCGDARSTCQFFQQALGMQLKGESHQGTGNDQCVSYGLVSHNVRMILTAPYSRKVYRDSTTTTTRTTSIATDGTSQIWCTPLIPGTGALPGFSIDQAHEWIVQHGTFVQAIGIVVENVEHAYQQAVANGGIGRTPPTRFMVVPVSSQPTTTSSIAQQQQQQQVDHSYYDLAELELYGHVVLRLVSESVASCDTVMPHLVPPPAMDKDTTTTTTTVSFGLERMDHIVGNVPILQETREYIQNMTGYHEFAEFTAADVGTMESGLNSVVLANDNCTILLPLNEPVSGMARKSQIQTYLEQNEGPGVQHVALKTRDIIATIRQMKQNRNNVGFELMKRPNQEYYRDLPQRLGDQLTSEQYLALEELGILADADDEGVLLQIFTKPIGDRPTFFFEIIQRIGCPLVSTTTNQQQQQQQLLENNDHNSTTETNDNEHQWWARLDERPGCGGFGRGNFRALFKSIEEHEKTLKV